MAGPEKHSNKEMPHRALTERERQVLGFGAGLVGVLSAVAQFLAVDVRHGLELLAISTVVVAVGIVLTLGIIRVWQSGRRRVTLPLNVVILAVGLFAALGVVGGLVGHKLGISARPETNHSAGGATSTLLTPTATAPSSTSVSAPSACVDQLGEPGVVAVQIVAEPEGLTICPVLLNNGLPITGPFTVAGEFLGPARLYQNLTIVNRGDPETCDTDGKPPASGLFYAQGFAVNQDGTWSFTDPLGYTGAVTIARNYEIISASPPSIDTIKGDRGVWDRTHPKNSYYPGMTTLPADAKVLAIFRQPPGKYKGTGSPCKNT